MPAAKLKTPDRMTSEAMGNSFRRSSAQANVRLLMANIEKLRQNSQSELEGWQSLTKAVE
jgi:hypothetical protein